MSLPRRISHAVWWTGVHPSALPTQALAGRDEAVGHHSHIGEVSECIFSGCGSRQTRASGVDEDAETLQGVT
jgi:hypothetical protein